VLDAEDPRDAARAWIVRRYALRSCSYGRCGRRPHVEQRYPDGLETICAEKQWPQVACCRCVLGAGAAGVAAAAG